MHIKSLLKKILKALRLDHQKVVKSIRVWSINSSLSQSMTSLVERLKAIIPDISNQYSTNDLSSDDYPGFKLRAQQAFQCSLMLKALTIFPLDKKIIVVDIGDSAGTHMLYLKELTKDKMKIDTISVNLDPQAIEKIRKRGLEAILSRAEDLDLGKRKVDLFTTFEMVEHLHNPAIFFHRLAKKSECNKIVLTVPYLNASRVGLHSIRSKAYKAITAEKEHVFELNPHDWKLLFLHSGWNVVHDEIYYQYPKSIPVISNVLSWFWRTTDFEGFWGAILEKDTSFSELYQDWED